MTTTSTKQSTLDDYVEYTGELPKLMRAIDDALTREDWLAAQEASVESRAVLNSLNRWLVRKGALK